MPETSQNRRPELMSPAGGMSQMQAAVAAGADAIYFGLQHFSARAKVGFSLEELTDVVSYLHRHGVKGFVTFNTLVFEHELAQARDTIIRIAESGADAVIVQDVGVAKMAHQLVPDLAIHGSTQMSITSAEGAELAASLGCSRVVLGRELSVADIRRIAAVTDVELEVFVHGALCVSYSGQCFSSEAWGGRSANRGQCAQACRLSYDLIVDGEHRELGDSRYLLSPGDLYALQQVAELIDIGVACFKIEGRYKGPEYVALTTKAYRDAIDTALCDSSTETIAERERVSVSKDELEQVYSRGLGPSFIGGVNHQNVVAGRVPRHRGLKVGEVVGVGRLSITVACDHRISLGDGLVFDSADWRSPDEAEEGGNVFEVEELQSGELKLSFGYDEIDFSRIRNGDLVFRTKDPAVNKKAKVIARQQPPTTGLRFTVVANSGQPLRIEASSDRKDHATFESDEDLSVASSRSLDNTVVTGQLSRLGNTPFHLTNVELTTDGNTFCPVSVLNKARRILVDELIRKREMAPKIQVRSIAAAPHRNELKDTHRPQLHLLVRSAEQLSAAIELCPASITLDYLELYGLRPAVEAVQAAGIVARVASPRILKPSEQKVVRFLLSLECQLLVRSGGLLHDLISNYSDNPKYKLPELHGDFSLNTANSRSFEAYLEMGVSRITPTYDLNAEQIEDLAQVFETQHVEVVAFHHLPVFHTEHCVFCRFLSDGTDNTNCGHPCEKHKIALRDARGRRHAVVADVGCRNTVFNAEAQASSAHMSRWIKAGLCHYRVEFVHQTAEDVHNIGSAFVEYFSDMNANLLEQRLRKHTQQGISEGSLFVPDQFKQLVQLGG